MNEADKKVIEELLAKQTESFSQAMDTRFQKQEKRLDTRFQEQSDAFAKQMDVRFEEQEERLEQRIDARFQEQAEHFEQRMIHVFNEGFEQVIMPHIIEMKEDIQDLRSSQDRMERKVNAVLDRQDRQGEEIKGIKNFIKMPEGA